MCVSPDYRERGAMSRLMKTAVEELEKAGCVCIVLNGDVYKRQGEQNMIVSAGLGEHTIPVRFHNPRELICITVKSPKEDVLWQYR